MDVVNLVVISVQFLKSALKSNVFECLLCVCAVIGGFLMVVIYEKGDMLHCSMSPFSIFAAKDGLRPFSPHLPERRNLPW